MSLHLFLHRPGSGYDKSSDPLFGPYISILPREFKSHPLTWRVTRDLFGKDASVEADLLDDLPPSAVVALNKVKERFWKDWVAVFKYIQEHPSVLDKLPCHREAIRLQADKFDAVMGFVWAWLNVNTRCIYHRLKPSLADPDNLTLCPILDFANHTATGPQMLPAPALADTSASRREAIGMDFTLLSPHDTTITEGQELYLTYGAHCNRTLFVEYGFVIDIPNDATSRTDFTGEVDAQDVVESLLEAEDGSRSWMKATLTEEGYWGDWTLHSSPQPAHPSYRLVTALRLCHLPRAKTGSYWPEEDALQSWRDTLLGKQDIISEQNELDWRATLVEICSTLSDRSSRRLDGTPTQRSSSEWVASMHTNIRTLWEEELVVAAAVANSVEQGEQF